ncbi:MAG: hypothetical protein IJR26_10860 [Bacteroidales bacterium]|nr:hypothetical protein [Bacteroidales bacterium]
MNTVSRHGNTYEKLYITPTKRTHPDAGETRYTYDNAGNLLTEVNPLGQINYDYTYYRVLQKRYSDMTGNDVTYTYGTKRDCWWLWN